MKAGKDSPRLNAVQSAKLGAKGIGLVLITSDQNACHGNFWVLKND